MSYIVTTASSAGASRYYHHCQWRLTPSPREARAGRGSWRGGRFFGYNVLAPPLSLTLSPLLRRGARELLARDGDAVEMLPSSAETSCSPALRDNELRLLPYSKG